MDAEAGAGLDPLATLQEQAPGTADRLRRKLCQVPDARHSGSPHHILKEPRQYRHTLYAGQMELPCSLPINRVPAISIECKRLGSQSSAAYASFDSFAIISAPPLSGGIGLLSVLARSVSGVMTGRKEMIDRSHKQSRIRRSFSPSAVSACTIPHIQFLTST